MKSILSRVEPIENIVLEKVPLPEGHFKMRQYVREKLIGEGQFSKCYIFTESETGNKFACKQISKSSLN